jgi:ABC-type transport system involved in multi-copper enzyme maturation permease subunit
MLRHIIRKEILEHMMSLRFAIACVLCFTVILASLFVRGQEYRIAAGDYREESVTLRNEIENMRYPGQIVWSGIKLLQAPNPLSVFVRGVEDSNGLSVRVNADQPPQLVTSEQRDPLIFLFPAMDLVNFVGIIMSLLAIVFGYDAICGEKERGTLRLMLSYSVPRDRLLLAKWIGGYVALVIPFLLAVFSGAAIVLAQPDVSLTSGEWVRLGAVCGLALLYIAAMYWMAIWVSCLTQRSATSALVLATIWMVLVLAVPNLSPYIARALRPTSNPLELEVTRAAARLDIGRRELQDKMDAYDAAHGFGKNWRADLNMDNEDTRKRVALRTLEWNKCMKTAAVARLDAYERLDEAFQSELDSQISLTRWISRLSPFSCFAMFASEITDTGVLGKSRFLSQIRGYQRPLTEYAFDEMRAFQEQQAQNKGKWVPWSEIRKKPIPLFTYVPAAGMDYLRSVAVDAGIIVGLGVLFFMLSHVAFLRYDVR